MFCKLCGSISLQRSIKFITSSSKFNYIFNSFKMTRRKPCLLFSYPGPGMLHSHIAPFSPFRLRILCVPSSALSSHGRQSSLTAANRRHSVMLSLSLSSHRGITPTVYTAVSTFVAQFPHFLQSVRKRNSAKRSEAAASNLKEQFWL